MIWYYIISFFTQLIDAFAGFGSTAIGLPFLSLSMKTSSAVALLSINSHIASIVVLCLHYREVNVKEWLRMTLLILIVLPVGLFAFSALSAYDMLFKLILGVVVIFIAGRYLYWRFIRRSEPAVPSTAMQYTGLVAGAVIQGMFSTGGPLITLYAANRLKDKDEFRATMSAMWVSVNTIAIPARALLTHIYTKELLLSSVKCLPIIALGCAAGLYLHSKVENSVFRTAIYIILMLGGLTALVYSLANLI